MSTSILYLEICVFDIIDKASMHGESIYTVMGQSFCALVGKEWTNIAEPWGAQIQDNLSTSLGWILIESPHEACKQKLTFAHFLYFKGTILPRLNCPCAWSRLKEHNPLWKFCNWTCHWMRLCDTITNTYFMSLSLCCALFSYTSFWHHQMYLTSPNCLWHLR